MIAIFPANWLIFFPIAFCLFIALRIAQGSADGIHRSWGVLIIRLLLALLFAYALIGVGLRGTLLSIVWLVMLAVFATVLMWKNRRLERSAILHAALNTRTLESRQALARYLETENVGWIRRCARRIQRDLATGVAWGQTLERRRVARSVYEKIAVRLQGNYGSVANSGDEDDLQTVKHPLQIEDSVEHLMGRVFIFSWVLLLGPIIALIMVFIVPTLKEMFEEFGMSLPDSTLAMINMADFSVAYGIVHLAALLLLFLMMAFGCVILLYVVPGLTTYPPFFWFCRDYYRNAGFLVFGQALEHERGLTEACLKTSELTPVKDVAMRFESVAAQLDGGAPVRNAFVHSRLISPRESDALGATIDNGDPLWGLREIIAAKTVRMLSRYSVLMQILVVVLTIALGAIVALVAMGLIEALAEMILQLSGQPDS